MYTINVRDQHGIILAVKITVGVPDIGDKIYVKDSILTVFGRLWDMNTSLDNSSNQVVEIEVRP